MRSIDQVPHLSGVHEEGLAAAVAELAIALVARQKPETRRNLGSVEELTRQGDHAVHEVGLDDVLADLSLAGWLDDIEPLASTKPAMPFGARW